MEIPLELIKIQDRYNKSNIEQQHKLNLDIFEKQATLTREIQEKQSILTKRITIITAVCSIIASIIGAIAGGLIVFWLNTPQQQNQTKTQIQLNQGTSVPKKDSGRLPETKIKSSAQEESSSTNVSSKKSPQPIAPPDRPKAGVR